MQHCGTKPETELLQSLVTKWNTQARNLLREAHAGPLAGGTRDLKEVAAARLFGCALQLQDMLECQPFSEDERAGLLLSASQVGAFRQCP